MNARMRAESRSEILKAARRLFAKRGYFGCKIADIAKAAGMSTGNIYWYFENKKDILKAILQAGFDAQTSVLEAAAALPGTGQEKLHHLVREYVTLCQEQSDFVTIFVSLLGHGSRSPLNDLGFNTVDIGAHYHELLRSILIQGQAEGTVVDGEPETLVMAFFAFFNGLMTTYGEAWLARETQPFEAAILRLLCREGDEEEIT